MIEKYSPNDNNKHIVRLTFNADGYVGHISDSIYGNCRGYEILLSGLNILEDYDQEAINSLVENDCDLKYDEDSDTYSITLTKQGFHSSICYDDLTEDDLKNMVVGIEIVSCEEDMRE